jgi:hypothetical protein
VHCTVIRGTSRLVFQTTKKAAVQREELRIVRREFELSSISKGVINCVVIVLYLATLRNVGDTEVSGLFVETHILVSRTSSGVAQKQQKTRELRHRTGWFPGSFLHSWLFACCTVVTEHS